MKKIFVRSFGCQMNEADSQEMLAALLARGYAETTSLKEADAVLVNTCTVRDHAEHRAISYIGSLAGWKKAAKSPRTIIVAGCAAERLGDALKKRFAHVDLAAGAKSIEIFPRLLDETGIAAGAAAAPNAQSAICAYLTVMRGCNCSCAYCIVPAVRGPAKFRNPEDIVREAELKVRSGARELTLLGQTVNSYRAGDCDFAQLLRRVHAVEGLLRLRFMSPHPAFVTDSLIEAFGSLPKLVRHIHLPAQSGSDRVLALMRRGYDRRRFLETVSKLRRAVPDIAISTDFIVGFPTETAEDFAQTLSLADEAEVMNAYCFKFSPRQGTAAADMAGQAPCEVTESRLNTLLEKIKSRARGHAESLRRKTVEVLLESGEAGRTPENMWASVKGAGSPGELALTEVRSVRDCTISCEIKGGVPS